MNENIAGNNMLRSGKFFVVHYAKITDDIERDNAFSGHFYHPDTGKII